MSKAITLEVCLMLIFTMAWPGSAAVVVGAFGLICIWLGLRGRRGRRGLLSGRDGMLGRIEGFRLVVFGLVLIGVLTAVVCEARWLGLLSLGIGFVEILESSALIAVWKWDRHRREPGRLGFPALGDPTG
jgi:hypothetical protein